MLFFCAVTYALLSKKRMQLRWHLHVHHYFMSGILLPFFISTSGASAWRWCALVCGGVCMGVLVEGAARWSFAPLWYAQLKADAASDDSGNPRDSSLWDDLPPEGMRRYSTSVSSVSSLGSQDTEMESVIEEGEEGEEEEEDDDEETKVAVVVEQEPSPAASTDAPAKQRGVSANMKYPEDMVSSRGSNFEAGNPIHAQAEAQAEAQVATEAGSARVINPVMRQQSALVQKKGSGASSGAKSVAHL